MEHEFIQTSNEYLQYLSDLGRFAVQNLEISARQEEIIKFIPIKQLKKYKKN